MNRMIICMILAIPLLTTMLSAQQTERNILLEEFSTAQCGFCPDGTVIAEQIVKDHPSVIWVTHHSGFGVDAMTADGSAAIASAFTRFAPSALIDRGAYPKHVSPYIDEGLIATTRQKWDSVVTELLTTEKYVDIDISSTFYTEINGVLGVMDLVIEIVFTSVPESGDIRFNLFIVDDAIVGEGKGYDQRNYYNNQKGHPMYGLGDTVKGYVHKRVVRAIPTGPWGEEGIIPSVPEIGKTYIYDFNSFVTDVMEEPYAIPPTDLRFVAFLSYYDEDPLKRKVIHAAESKVDKIVGDAEDVPSAPGSISLTTYPNPASNRVQFIVSGQAATHSTLLVTDHTGRTVATLQIDPGQTSYTMPVAHLPNGVYFYRALTASGPGTAGKFMVMR